jgi:prepilin-type processing-associated H-X9-DG protein
MWRLPTDGGSGQGLMRQSFSFQPSIDYIGTGDGTGNTLLLTENLNAGQWYGADVNSIGFGLRVDTTSGAPAAGQFVSTSLATTLDAYNTNTYWFINRPQQSGMSAPRPSSQHIGGVNVMMCDGSGKFVSENISKDVFAKLLTSNGVTYGEVTLNPSSY